MSSVNERISLERKMQLDAHQLSVLELELKNRSKSMLVGYILWYFLGIFGGHRFYMGRTGSAVAQLILTITVIGLIITAIWWVVDAFLLHTWIKDKNQEIELQIIDELQYRNRSSVIS